MSDANQNKHGAKSLGVVCGMWHISNGQENLLFWNQTLESVDAACSLAGVTTKILITSLPNAAGIVRDGWTVLHVSLLELQSYAEIGAKHAGHCDWLYVHCGGVMERQTLVNARHAISVGAQMENLVKIEQPTAAENPAGWNPQAETEAYGLTVVTPGYEKLADEASRRFRKFTGLPVIRLEADTRDGFGAKLHALLMMQVHERQQWVVYFDADLWLLRETDFTPYFEDDVVAGVPDRGVYDEGSFAQKDCQTLDLAPGLYFNSGLLVLDMQSTKVNWAVNVAKDLFAKRSGLGVLDFGEQSVLNAGIQQECDKDSIMKLPESYNFFMHGVKHGYATIPPLVHGLHAAGVPLAKKFETLKREAEVFGFPTPAQKYQ